MSTERGFRPRQKSAKHQKSTSKSVSDADIYELSRNRTSVADFASSHELLSKSGSEIEIISAEKSVGKVVRKQAWAPPQRASLSSSSSRFRREPTPSLPPHPDTPLPRHEVRYGELPKVNYINHKPLQKKTYVVNKSSSFKLFFHRLKITLILDAWSD